MITAQDVRSSWAIAREHIIHKRFDSAEKILDLLYSKVTHLELALDYANVLMKLKKFTEAQVVIDRGLTKYPIEQRLYALKASLLYISGKPQDALSLYKMLLADHPENPAYWTNAAYCACLENHFEDAVEFFQRSEDLITNFPSAWFRNYAIALLMSKQPKKAISYFEKLALQSVLDSECWFHYGLAFNLIGDEYQAQNAYLKALEQDRNHIASLYNLSILYQRNAQYREAKECWETILSVQPDHILAKTLLDAAMGNSLSQLPLPFVQALFDQYSFNYDEHLKGILEYTAPAQARSMLMKHFPDSKPGVVIDLGAGTGVMGRIMRDLATHMTAIDCSAGMLLQARTSQMYNRYIETDIIEWAAQTEVTADYFTLIEVTNYLGPITADVLQNLWKHLNPGGTIVLTAEALPDTSEQNVALLPTARFAFKEEFFKDISNHLANSQYVVERMSIRKHGQDIVDGLYVILKKTEIEKTV